MTDAPYLGSILGVEPTWYHVPPSLGPLADPTPAESALSLLRAAWDKESAEPWPKDYEYPLLRAEERAITWAHNLLREPYDKHRAEGRRLTAIGHACYWASEALRSKAQGDLARETRMAGRVTELLSWMSGDGK